MLFTVQSTTMKCWFMATHC